MSSIPDIRQWEDYGLGGEATTIQEPEDWRLYGLPNFAAYSGILGVISGDEIETIGVEVDEALYGNRVLARTPLIELAPRDYNWIKIMKKPYHGMLGLGDDGQVYEYDQGLGFFKKLFRKVKGAVKKVARKVRGGIQKVLKRLPGGKYLLKFGQKIFKIASKLVKPLIKYVGKYAAKLAPVAALIPGYGPAIAAGLYAAGKVANLMQEYGAKLKKVKGALRTLTFPKGAKSAKAFQRALKRAASAELHKAKRMGGKKYRAALTR